jgi:hypothetical protein
MTTRSRIGDWMQTVSGRQFWPLDPRPEEVLIGDIAHALAMQCRFAGHCRRFYSVAEHSVLLSRAVAPEHKLWALLHDASEAYLVDVPRPVKPYLAGYRSAERRVMIAVCDRFGLPREMPSAVKVADDAILMDEAAQNMSPPEVPWGFKVPPLGVTLQYLSPAEARSEFLGVFEELTGAST